MVETSRHHVFILFLLLLLVEHSNVLICQKSTFVQLADACKSGAGCPSRQNPGCPRKRDSETEPRATFGVRFLPCPLPVLTRPAPASNFASTTICLGGGQEGFFIGKFNET